MLIRRGIWSRVTSRLVKQAIAGRIDEDEDKEEDDKINRYVPKRQQIDGVANHIKLRRRGCLYK